MALTSIQRFDVDDAFAAGVLVIIFFFSSRRLHTRCGRDWSSDVCSSDLIAVPSRFKKGVVGLVLPTGYSFNLDGTAIYLTLASMFIAQACDIHLSWTQIAAMLGLMLQIGRASCRERV